MKETDRIYCIKDYINSDNIKINTKGEYYNIIAFTNFHGNRNDVVVSITTNDITTNVFWLKYQRFDDNWNNMRANNLFSTYFVTEKEYRKLKLKKLNGTL